MSKELYGVTIDYTKDYNGESWIATISDEKYIDIGTFERTKVDLETKLAESEKQVKHWHDLYNDRDKQFQSVRQRYHLLNKLQSNYDKKDKLHLAYMQCAELVEENEKLKQQLAEKESELAIFKKRDIDNQKQLEMQMNIHKHYLIKKDQNKISFCIEKLEKVKNKFNGKRPIDDLANEFGLELGYTATQIQKYIDDQINELREGK